VELSLFRIKVLLDPQRDAFRPTAPRPDILREAIESRPGAESTRGRTWWIANTEPVGAEGLYFRFGRNAPRVLPISDGAGDFGERFVEAAPHVHIVVDLATEVCAISHNADLAATPEAIARRLKEVLNSTGATEKFGVRFHVSAIKQPDTFLHELQAAYAVTSFTIYFTPPNPFDIKDDFHKEMEALAQEAGASTGRTVIRGEALDTERLERLTRSAAATGDNVRARVKTERGTKPRPAALKGTTARVTAPATAETEGGRRGLLARVKEAYQQIRGNDNGSSSETA
jgi:hypothetical protein